MTTLWVDGRRVLKWTLRRQSWVLVNMVMNLCVQLEASYFMTSRPINNVYRRILVQCVARLTNPITVCNKKDVLHFIIDRLIFQPLSHLDRQSVSYSVRQSVSQSVNQSVSQSVSQSVYLVKKTLFS
jgi:hypothetical protein